jgi:hypothetical protein
MKLNISIKTLVLLQGILVIGSLSGAMFFGIGTEHVPSSLSCSVDCNLFSSF